MAFSNQTLELAGIAEFLFHDFHTFFPDELHDLIHQGIGKNDLDEILFHSGDDPSMLDGAGSSRSIGMDESPYTKLGTSEIPDHHDEYIAEIMRFDLSEYWVTSGTRGLSVITGPVNLFLCTQPVCKAMMPCIVVLLSQCVQYLFYLLRCFNGEDKALSAHRPEGSEASTRFARWGPKGSF